MDKNLTELLIGWKEISAYTGVNIETLKLWQNQLDFPFKMVPFANRKDNKIIAVSRSAVNEWLNHTFANKNGDYLVNKGLV